MKSKSPLVYIIVLNWNNYEDTRECIKRLEEINYSNFKILIVDNNSTDGSQEKINNEFSHHELLFNDENYGYTGGNNRGIKLALENHAEFIVVSNNDIVIESNEIITEMSKFMQQHPNCGVIGPKIISYEDHILMSNYVGSVWWNAIRKKFINSKLSFDNNAIRSPVLLGSFLMISAKTFEKIGYFDEKFFMYGEEHDFIIRLLKQNIDVIYFQNETVYRKTYNDGIKYNNRIAYYNSRNKIKLVKKNFSGFFQMYMLSLTLLIEWKDIFLSLMSKNKVIARSILKGMLDGLNNVSGKVDKFH